LPYTGPPPLGLDSFPETLSVHSGLLLPKNVDFVGLGTTVSARDRERDLWNTVLYMIKSLSFTCSSVYLIHHKRKPHPNKKKGIIPLRDNFTA
jgi:hypothetical protein